MSCYGWERGEFTLPTAEVAKVKGKLREWQNDLHEAVRAEAVRIHRSIDTRSVAKYQQVLNAIPWQTPATNRNIYSSRPFLAPASDNRVRPLARLVLGNILRSGTVHSPTVADVTAVVPKATSKTTVYRALDENGLSDASFSFEGRVVTYSVSENNHAVDNANDNPTVQAFFGLLAGLTWTRGSGGYTVGNDEYNRDSDNAGGGGNYLVRHYGPLGRDAEIQDLMRRGFSAAKAKEFTAPKPVTTQGFKRYPTRRTMSRW